MSTALVEVHRQLDQMGPRFDAAIPGAAGVSASRLITTVLASCERNPRLLDCTRESLIMSTMTIAVWGLVADGITGQAYLIPRKDHGTLKAQAQPGYKGIVSMCARSGWIISSQVVRANDPFRVIEGSDPRIDHDIAHFTNAERGGPIGAYAVARSLRFPSVHWWMPKEEILAIRNRSQAYTSKAATPWKTDPMAMWLKCPILHLGRRLPLELLQTAVAVEEQSELGRFAYVTPDGLVHVEGEALEPVTRETQALDERLGITDASTDEDTETP